MVGRPHQGGEGHTCQICDRHVHTGGCLSCPCSGRGKELTKMLGRDEKAWKHPKNGRWFRHSNSNTVCNSKYSFQNPGYSLALGFLNCKLRVLITSLKTTLQHSLSDSFETLKIHLITCILIPLARYNSYFSWNIQNNAAPSMVCGRCWFSNCLFQIFNMIRTETESRCWVT